jgi:hypothetical protein
VFTFKVILVAGWRIEDQLGDYDISPGDRYVGLHYDSILVEGTSVYSLNL